MAIVTMRPFPLTGLYETPSQDTRQRWCTKRFLVPGFSLDSSTAWPGLAIHARPKKTAP